MSRQRVSPALQLYLLGSFRLQSGKSSIPLPAGKVQSLFAYLALHPGEHSREKLAELYWGDSTDAQARNSLRTTLKKLRKQLDARVLMSDRTTVQLNPALALWVDALEFRAQVTGAPDSAIALYHGDLGADFYDDWIVPERERYRELFLSALLKLTEHARTAGEYARAISYAHRVLAADPANERAHQHLMFCHVALGERNAALKQYATCVRALQTELAVAPSAETTALYQWIRSDRINKSASEPLLLAAQLTNLPIPVSSFVGRKQELTELKQALMTTRLLTLTGAGGSGKTRLAIQTATGLIDSFHDGVWWIDLAPRSDPAQVPQAVAQALGLRGEMPARPLRKKNNPVSDESLSPRQSIQASLVRFLRQKQILLVLDNCEHLVTASARLADTLLMHCPNVQILATSRQALGLAGETVYRVPSLSVPPEPLTLTEWLLGFESIRLFVERAGALRSDFRLTEQNAAAVLEICRRLDGIPLALELAAARIPVLTAAQIAERLHDRFALLTQGSCTALSRHQTLRGAMDWSHQLLTNAEQILFRRVAVFAGGFTLDAAQFVCSSTGIEKSAVLDLLSNLVAKSLVIAEAAGAGTRYRLLESIREYACEQLETLGELAEMRRRQRDFYIAFAEAAAPKLRGSEQFEWLARLEVEHDNWRAAWDCALSGDTRLALRLAAALLDFWLIRGDPGEGRRWLAELLARTRRWGQNSHHALALNLAGRLAHQQSDFAAARALLEASLERARVSGDTREIAFALLWLGRTALVRREYSLAQTLTEESVSLYEQLQDEWEMVQALHRLTDMAPQRGYSGQAQKESFMHVLARYRALGDRYMAAQVLNVLGENARLAGDYDSAAGFYEQALEILQPLGRFPPATPLFNLAWVALHKRDYGRARGLFQATLKLYREHTYKKGMVEKCLGGLAAILGMSGQPEAATRLFGAVQAMLENIGLAGWIETPDQKELDEYIAAIRAELDPLVFERAWRAGRTLTLEQALDYVTLVSGAVR